VPIRNRTRRAAAVISGMGHLRSLRSGRRARLAVDPGRCFIAMLLHCFSVRRAAARVVEPRLGLDGCEIGNTSRMYDARASQKSLA
jgi:hypothetical protein